MGLMDHLNDWKTTKAKDEEPGPGMKALKELLSGEVKTDEEAGLLASFLTELKGSKKGGK